MIVSVKDLNFSYPKRPQLFDGLHWYIPEGSVVGLLGKNGTGKSTLLHLLSGLLFPKSGTITLASHIPRERKPSFLAEVFFLADDIAYPGNMSIGAYEKIMGAFYPEFDSSQFDQILADFGLEKKVKLKELSLGERKKVFLSFGLSTNCRFLLFDEPTNGLDIPSKSIFRKVVAGNLTDEQTLIISTHLVADVENLIDRVAILNNGKIQLDADVLELSDRWVFGTSSNLPDEALHTEKVGTGYQFIRSRKHQEPQTPVSLELLFNAVLHNSINENSILQTQNSEVL
ncbi:ABC-2 type transport system ATP-binding protein [Algoriphagus ratkowskyi]|uniref:ABC transporter ATP-binding protein n=1 Tax=Algoriphagus ratkowskyi TaxID=57028 RepID=A0A2W7RRH9_9BACT|nr:ABC transporter ATP-binding protein [Algoriphagus ratkowskyi]PZX61120.1 ABC-2 type transport system ATP-binding protein [Algoriphagus ratkowskyi]TXD79250.1 ABC transporter ATP-binding protein [Algoriphagus ratkowskyi]